MSTLKDKTLFITGGSRGIGKAIALAAARDGANVVLAAKTAEPHPKLPGTIFSAAAEVEASGGCALPVQVDVRSDDQVEAAIEQAVETFGGLDILINNASAINLSGTMSLPMRRYDLMFDVNARGSFLCTKLALPHLLKAENPHVLNISPPLNLDAKWFSNHPAYTMAKYAMSAWVLGMAEEFRRDGVAVNALWPRTAIATAAVRNLLGGEQAVRASRKAAIMGDAAHIILTRDSRLCSGNFYLDEEVLAEEGVTELGSYSVEPGASLVTDFFLG